MTEFLASYAAILSTLVLLLLVRLMVRVSRIEALFRSASSEELLDLLDRECIKQVEAPQLPLTKRRGTS